MNDVLKQNLSILEKAKQLNNKSKKFSDEEVELALAWLNFEVTVAQTKQVINKKYSNNVYAFVAMALREGVKTKLIRGGAIRYFRRLKPLSPEARLERSSEWSPYFLGALQDNIKTKPSKVKK